MTKAHDTIREMTFADHITMLETHTLSIPLRDLVEVEADSIRRVMTRPRRNQNALSPAERNAFNSAIQATINDGTYQQLVAIHANTTYDMHRFMGQTFSATGLHRFLSWQRVYLDKLEELLQAYQPNLRIPYWDWAVDRQIPSWVAIPSGLTPAVTRGPSTTIQLPDQTRVNRILSQTTYANFTEELESSHDDVHGWVGGPTGTMRFIGRSPNDPLFWLHHANVDRIWAIWQQQRAKEEVLWAADVIRTKPSLTGAKAVMEPWPHTIANADDTYNLLYYYV
jgi:tyrosinase